MKPTLLLLAALSAVAALPLSAKLITQPVAYEHAGVKLAGYLAYDDTKVALDKKAPGVLVVPEWWGLTDYAKGRAEQLAKLGTALAARPCRRSLTAAHRWPAS